MSTQITTAFVEQYKANVIHLAQQQGTVLRPAVVQDTQVGEAAFVEQIGATVAQKKITRHGDSPQVDTPHDRRRLTLVDYEWGDFVDKEDQIRMLIDPASPYAVNASWAMGVAMDQEIIAAALGTAYTGKTGATAVTLPAAQKIAAGAVGLTVQKLRDSRKILLKGKVPPSNIEPWAFALTADQSSDLLGTTEVTSSDYNTVKALVDGEVDSFLGFRFRSTQEITKVGAVRECFAWSRNGIQLNIGAEVTTEITKRADKSFSTYVYLAMSIGAARLEEARVVQIDCTEV